MFRKKRSVNLMVLKIVPIFNSIHKYISKSFKGFSLFANVFVFAKNRHSSPFVHDSYCHESIRATLPYNLYEASAQAFVEHLRMLISTVLDA